MQHLGKRRGLNTERDQAADHALSDNKGPYRQADRTARCSHDNGRGHRPKQKRCRQMSRVQKQEEQDR
jgi:hypothetical protein